MGYVYVAWDLDLLRTVLYCQDGRRIEMAGIAIPEVLRVASVVLLETWDSKELLLQAGL